MEIVKNLDSTIEFIHNIQCEYELSNLPFDDRKGSLRIKDRHLEINFSLSLHESLNAIKIVDIGEFCLRNEHTMAKYIVRDCREKPKKVFNFSNELIDKVIEIS